MQVALDILSWTLLGLGTFFCLVGGIGLNRFPDFYTRIHANGVTDTLGAGLILVGLMFQTGEGLVLVKLAFLLSFLLMTSPISGHATAKAALQRGIQPQLVGGEEEEAE